MEYRKWCVVFSRLVIVTVFICAITVLVIDPCFHFRKPLPFLYYELYNQRYQNNGIFRHFDYNAIITGTSMTENFRSSEVDKIYSVNSIKTSFSGATYREINDNLSNAFKYNSSIKLIIRSLDLTHLNEDSNALRTDLGTYPVYLYNDKYTDDLNYILNKDAMKMAFKNIMSTFKKGHGGITSFDDYSYWNDYYKFGKEFVVREKFETNSKQTTLSVEDINRVEENVKKNVIELAKEHPDVTFYYFYPPYSIAYWAEENEKGNLVRTFDSVILATEMILKCPNIKLYYFGDMHEITTNFDNYKDTTHYGEHINSKILELMHKDIGLLKKESYKSVLAKERAFLISYPYDEI